MRFSLVRSTLFLAVFLSGTAATDALAQTPQELKARCSQLTSYFDYYGTSRGEHTDGPKNWKRINAGIECDRGNYEVGIRQMEELLVAKAFTVPRADVASTPDGRVSPIATAQPPADRTSQPQAKAH
jgi:hypothetical protein